MSASNIFKILNYRAVVQAINSGHVTARPFHVGFVVDGVLLGKVFSEYLGVLSVSFHRYSIPIFQTRFSFSCRRRYRILPFASVAKLNTYLVVYIYKKSHFLLCRLAVYAGYTEGICDEKQILWMCQTLNKKLQHSSTLTLFHYRFGRNF